MKYVHLKKENNKYSVYFCFSDIKLKIADVHIYHWAEKLSRMVAKEHSVNWRDIKNDVVDTYRRD